MKRIFMFVFISVFLQLNTFHVQAGVFSELNDPFVNTITLSFTGDCTLGTDDTFLGNTFDHVYQKVGDPAYFFNGVKAVLGTDDFTFINLEGALTTAVEKELKEYNYKGNPVYGDILVQGSIEGVTLANNHTLDYLYIGFQDTVNALNNYGIHYTNFETCFIKEIKGMQIGFLGYKGWDYEKGVRTLLEKQVNEMRKAGVDYIVANYHWGDIRSYTPNEQQKRMAHFAIDHGVDLVIGHHPHVLQGMETYRGKNIVYSLGNFCYGGSPVITDTDTIIYQQVISFDPSAGAVLNEEHRIIPAHVCPESNNNYQPILASEDEKKRILIKFAQLTGQLVSRPYLVDQKVPGMNRRISENIHQLLE